jgi:hypothetical protein
MEETTERDFAIDTTRTTAAFIPVVDNGQGVRISLSTLLSKMGFQDTQAVDGDEALD